MRHYPPDAQPARPPLVRRRTAVMLREPPREAAVLIASPHFTESFTTETISEGLPSDRRKSVTSQPQSTTLIGGGLDDVVGRSRQHHWGRPDRAAVCGSGRAGLGCGLPSETENSPPGWYTSTRDAPLPHRRRGIRMSYPRSSLRMWFGAPPWSGAPPEMPIECGSRTEPSGTGAPLWTDLPITARRHVPPQMCGG